MKAAVLETKEGRAAVFLDDGTMLYIEDGGYEPGQILEIDESVLAVNTAPKSRIMLLSDWTVRHRRLVAAALAAVLMVSVGGVSAYAAPVSTVTIDSEPSIEYRVNIFDRVVGFSTNSRNVESDEELSDKLDAVAKEVRGRKLNDAIDLTLSELTDTLVVESDDEEDIIAVTSLFSGKEKKLKESTDKDIRGKIKHTDKAKSDDTEKIKDDSKIPKISDDDAKENDELAVGGGADADMSKSDKSDDVGYGDEPIQESHTDTAHDNGSAAVSGGVSDVPPGGSSPGTENGEIKTEAPNGSEPLQNGNPDGVNMQNNGDGHSDGNYPPPTDR